MIGIDFLLLGRRNGWITSLTCFTLRQNCSNKCTLGLTILYGVNSFATTLMKSESTLFYLELPTHTNEMGQPMSTRTTLGIRMREVRRRIHINQIITEKWILLWRKME